MVLAKGRPGAAVVAVPIAVPTGTGHRVLCQKKKCPWEQRPGLQSGSLPQQLCPAPPRAFRHGASQRAWLQVPGARCPGDLAETKVAYSQLNFCDSTNVVGKEETGFFPGRNADALS